MRAASGPAEDQKPPRGTPLITCRTTQPAPNTPCSLRACTRKALWITIARVPASFLSLFSEAPRLVTPGSAGDRPAPEAAWPGRSQRGPAPRTPRVPSPHVRRSRTPLHLYACTRAAARGRPAGGALRRRPARLASPLCKSAPSSRRAFWVSPPPPTKRIKSEPGTREKRRSRRAAPERSAAPSRTAGERDRRRATRRPDLGGAAPSPSAGGGREFLNRPYLGVARLLDERVVRAALLTP